jgi:hypothetical protein
VNEQIRKLAEQSGLKIPLDAEYNGHIYRHALEKFAQLIVRECVEQGKIIQSQSIVNGPEEYVAGREMGIEVFMNQIRKHFGVES